MKYEYVVNRLLCVSYLTSTYLKREQLCFPFTILINEALCSFIDSNSSVIVRNPKCVLPWYCITLNTNRSNIPITLHHKMCRKNLFSLWLLCNYEMKSVLIIQVNYGFSPLLYLTSTNYIPLQDVFFCCNICHRLRNYIK